MLIHAVKTPRNIEVEFNGGRSFRGNRITLLTGSNGSGKTDVLATIADVFHGALRPMKGAHVLWTRDGEIHLAEGSDPYGDRRKGRIRVIAQTFSPFSRFPRLELEPPPISPIYARGHSSEEQYVCIGFHQNSKVDLRHLSLAIVENGILRLSEQPRVARVAFDVLQGLDFKDGIDLQYIADEKLKGLIKIANERAGIELAFAQYAKTGYFIAGGEYWGRKNTGPLIQEIRKGNVAEIAEYVRGAINIISSYSKEEISIPGNKAKKFVFTAFRGREGMSSDFPVLQSLSFLRRLGLLTLERCTLTSYLGHAVDLTHTSSGQQQMLCSIFGLAAALEDDAIVLIDEPELSLHPRWQMNFFDHLKTALDAVRDCHVIIATHSPLIAQAGVAHGAEIIHMADSVNEKSERLRHQREKSSVERLLVDIFDTPVPNSLHISNEIFSLVTNAEAGSESERKQSLYRLEKYLELYQRDGEGSSETIVLIKKAIQLIGGNISE